MHVLAPFVSATQKNVAGAPPLTWYFTGGLGTVTVGRKDTDILILTDNSISKTHATLTITEAEEVGQPPLITVKHQGRYHTKVNGQLVEGTPCALSVGDKVKFGFKSNFELGWLQITLLTAPGYGPLAPAQQAAGALGMQVIQEWSPNSDPVPSYCLVEEGSEVGPALAHALLAESLPVSLAWLEAMRQRKVWDVLPPHQAPQSLLLPPLDEGAAPHAVQLEGWQPPTEALLEGWIAIFSPAAHDPHLVGVVEHLGGAVKPWQQPPVASPSDTDLLVVATPEEASALAVQLAGSAMVVTTRVLIHCALVGDVRWLRKQLALAREVAIAAAAAAAPAAAASDEEEEDATASDMSQPESDDEEGEAQAMLPPEMQRHAVKRSAAAAAAPASGLPSSSTARGEAAAAQAPAAVTAAARTLSPRKGRQQAGKSAMQQESKHKGGAKRRAAEEEQLEEGWRRASTKPPLPLSPSPASSALPPSPAPQPAPSHTSRGGCRSKQQPAAPADDTAANGATTEEAHGDAHGVAAAEVLVLPVVAAPPARPPGRSSKEAAGRSGGAGAGVNFKAFRSKAQQAAGGQHAAAAARPAPAVDLVVWKPQDDSKEAEAFLQQERERLKRMKAADELFTAVVKPKQPKKARK